MVDLGDAAVVHGGLEGGIALGEDDDAFGLCSAHLGGLDVVVDEAHVRALDVEREEGVGVGGSDADATRGDSGERRNKQQFLHVVIP